MCHPKCLVCRQYHDSRMRRLRRYEDKSPLEMLLERMARDAERIDNYRRRAKEAR